MIENVPSPFFYAPIISLKKKLDCGNISKSTLLLLGVLILNNTEEEKNCVDNIKGFGFFSKDDHFDELYKNYRLVKSEKKDKSSVYDILKNYQDSNDLVELTFVAFTYGQEGNIARFEKVLKKILNREFHYYMFNSRWSYKKQLGKWSFFLELLQSIEKFAEDNKMFELYLFYLYSNIEGEFRKDLDRKFTFSRGLNYIRRGYNSNNFSGEKFPYLWGVSLYNESSMNEFYNFVKTFNLSSKLSNDPSLALFFNSFAVVNKNSKSRLDKSLIILNKSIGHKKEVFLRLLEFPEITQVIKNNRSFKKLLVLSREKRSFYLKEFGQKPSYYSLIRLFQLGDQDPSYLR